MITMVPVKLTGGTAIGTMVELDRIHPERKIIAARVIGVREMKDLLNAKIVEMTNEAKTLGIKEGMTGKEALEKMF